MQQTSNPPKSSYKAFSILIVICAFVSTVFSPARAATPAQAYYDVWAGNTLDLSKTYYNVDKMTGYTKLGTANRTTTFSGRYNYYIVATRPGQVLYMDAAQTSDGAYYNNGSIAVGNVGGTANGIFGPPDYVYLVLNGGAAGGTSTYGSYAILYNTGGWTSMRFIVYEPQVTPAITAQPSRQTAPAGDTVQMKIKAIGAPPLFCQWSKNGTNLSSGGRLTGATTPILTITGLQPDDEGIYTVTVTNIHGSITSAASPLTVAMPAQAFYDVWGGDVLDLNKMYYDVDKFGYTFLGSTNRDATFNGKYKYYVVAVRLGARLFLDAAQTSSGAYYPKGTIATGNVGTGILGGAFGAPDGRYLLLNAWDSGWSPYTYGSYAIFYNTGGWNSMRFLVFSPEVLPAIETPPASQLVFAGETVRLPVQASGRAPIRYQWRKNDVPLVSGGRISGTAGTNLVISSVKTTDAGSYSVVVSNIYGRVTGGPVNLGVVVPPRSQTNTLGGTASLTVQIAGSVVPSCRWSKDGVELVDNDHVSGSGTTTLVITNLQFADAGTYSVALTGEFDGTKTSPQIGLKVLDRIPPFLETSLGAFELLASSSIVLSGTASDHLRGENGIVSVTVNGLRASNMVATAGAVAHWQKPLTLLNGTNTIKVIAKDGAGNATTNILRLVCDTLRPLVRILSPLPAQRLTNSTLTIKGSIVDKTASRVWCRLNSLDWIEASRSGPTNWTAQFTLDVGGTNTLYAMAVDAAGNQSLTNSVSFRYAELLDLAEYYPLPLGAEWNYEGSDWEGQPAKQVYRVQSTNHSVTFYTGRTTPRSYVTNCIQKYCAYLSPETLVPYDEWEDYLAIGGTFAFMGGDDNGGSIRLDKGLRFPKSMAIGDTATAQADAYMNARFVGMVTATLTLLDRGPVSVPAGTFEDVLHFRISFKLPTETQVHDEWWAEGVGNIKAQGISGGGAPESWQLINYSLPPGS